MDELVDKGCLYRLKLLSFAASASAIAAGTNAPSSASAITDTKAPWSPSDVDLSDYPPGTDIEYRLYWYEGRVVAKVPRWAQEKYKDAGGKRRLCEDHLNSVSATAAFGTKALKRPCEDLVENSSASGSTSGGKRTCEDRPPNSTSATVATSGTKALKRPCEDLVENPSATVAPFVIPYMQTSPCQTSPGPTGGKNPCEDHLNSASATAATSGTKALNRPCEDLVENPSAAVAASVMPDMQTGPRQNAQVRYRIVWEGGRFVREVDRRVRRPLLVPGSTPKVKGGFYFPKSPKGRIYDLVPKN